MEPLPKAAATADVPPPCIVDDDCTVSYYQAPVSSAQACHCLTCPVIMNSAAAAAFQSQYERYCASQTAGAMAACPKLPCRYPGPPACLDGTCVDFPPATWLSFAVDHRQRGVMSPPACHAGEGCSLWKITPDARVIVSHDGVETTSTLSAEDFSTIDQILRTRAFRQDEKDGFHCSPRPAGVPTIALAFEYRNSTIANEVTGCVLSGPPGNVPQRLNQIVQRY